MKIRKKQTIKQPEEETSPPPPNRPQNHHIDPKASPERASRPRCTANDTITNYSKECTRTSVFFWVMKLLLLLLLHRHLQLSFESPTTLNRLLPPPLVSPQHSYMSSGRKYRLSLQLARWSVCTGEMLRERWLDGSWQRGETEYSWLSKHCLVVV